MNRNLPPIRASEPDMTKDLVLASLPVTIAAAEDEDKLPQVDLVAYNGGIMRVAYWGDVVIDLKGVRIPRQVKLFADHDHSTDGTIGHVKAVIKDGKILESGVISRGGARGRDIAAKAADGVEWEASVDLNPLIYQYVKAGETFEANGRKIKAAAYGVYYIKRSILKGTSIVPLGADDNTKVNIAALAAAQRGGFAMEFAAWLKAKGFAPEDLSDEQTATLKAAYDAEMADKDAKPDPKPDPKPDKKTVTAADPPAPDPKVVVAADADDDPVETARKAVRAAAAEETERVAELHNLCAGHADIEAKAIKEGWTAEHAELEVLRASRSIPTIITGASDSVPQGRILEAAVRLAGVERSEVVEKAYDEQTLDAASRFRNMGLREIITVCAAMDGRPRVRIGASPDEYLRAAFSTISLSTILGNTANKVALDAYRAVAGVVDQVCKKLTANDFKAHTAVRMTGNMVPPIVGADGELKHVTLGESSMTYRVATYGEILTITRQDIVNDDLNIFTQIPQMFGRGCGLLKEELFFTLLLANTGSFFSADNSNYITDALDSDALTTAEATLLDMEDADGKPIMVDPSILLVPTALAGTAQELYVSRNINTGGSSTKARQPDANIHSGKYKPVVGRHLSKAAFTGYSATGWYLFGRPEDIAAFGVAYLRGNETPVFENAALSSDVLGQGWRGYFDVGVCQLEEEGAVMSTGAA